MEAIAALGLASNIIQFVDFGTKLCARIDDFSAKAGKALGKISALTERLSLILKTLEALDLESLKVVDNEEKTIEACITQIEELDKVLARFTVQENKERASYWRRGVEIS